jgi:hypothetical protein
MIRKPKLTPTPLDRITRITTVLRASTDWYAKPRRGATKIAEYVRTSIAARKAWQRRYMWAVSAAKPRRRRTPANAPRR